MFRKRVRIQRCHPSVADQRSEGTDTPFSQGDLGAVVAF